MPIRLAEKRSGTAFLLVFWVVAELVASCGAQDALIQAGHLVDPASNTVVAHHSILVHAGKIAAVGENLKVPEGVEVIDLSDAWVLPGLDRKSTRLNSSH